MGRKFSLGHGFRPTLRLSPRLRPLAKRASTRDKHRRLSHISATPLLPEDPSSVYRISLCLYTARNLPLSAELHTHKPIALDFSTQIAYKQTVLNGKVRPFPAGNAAEIGSDSSEPKTRTSRAVKRLQGTQQ